MPEPVEVLIQNIVHSVDQGIIYRVVRVGLFLLAIVLLMLLYMSTQFTGFADEEAMDCAQLGRNIMSGRGFVTQNVRPASIWYLAKNKKAKFGRSMLLKHPDIVHAPLYPLALASIFRVANPSFSAGRGRGRYAPEQKLIVPFGFVCTLFSAGFLFLLGKTLFSRRIALTSLVLYLLTDSVLADSISGLPISLTALLLTGGLYFAVLAVSLRNDGRRLWWWLIPLICSCVFAVLAFLTRYVAGLLALGLFLYIGLGFRTRGWRWGAAFLACFLVGILPWLLRNYIVSGGPLGLAPYGVLNETKEFAENAFDRTLQIGRITEPRVTDNLSRKCVGNLEEMFANHLGVFKGGVLFVFFFCSFLFRFSRREVGLLRWCMAIVILFWLLVGSLFGEVTLRLCTALLPFMFLYGVAFFFAMADRLQFRLPVMNLAVVLLVGLLQATPLIVRLFPPRAPIPYPPYHAPFIAGLCELYRADEVICSDIPAGAAWYGNRVTLGLPAKVDDFLAIYDNIGTIAAIYFTTKTRDQPFATTMLRGRNATWRPMILNEDIPKDFPLTTGVHLNMKDQFLLSDYPRWMRQ